MSSGLREGQSPELLEPPAELDPTQLLLELLPADELELPPLVKPPPTAIFNMI